MVAELLARIQPRFESHRDPRKAGEMAAYMRDQFPFLGIPTPLRRRLTREAIRGVAAPSEPQLVRLARKTWRLPEREYQYLGLDLTAAWVGVASPGFLETARWLVTTRSWWDTVDGLASHVVGGLVTRHPRLVRQMDRWSRDANLWVVRTAILHQLRYQAATDEARLFEYCLRNARSSEFFLRKAIGWSLREYSKTAPGAVERFVAKHEARLSPLSQREALKWLARGARRSSRKR